LKFLYCELSAEPAAVSIGHDYRKLREFTFCGRIWVPPLYRIGWFQDLPKYCDTAMSHHVGIMSAQERAYRSNWIYERVVLEEFFGPQKCAMKSALIG
jgi:hypothetical protein